MGRMGNRWAGDVNDTDVKKAEKTEGGKDAWFFLTVLYFLVEYGRPQDLFPPLGVVRPGLVLGLLLLVSAFTSGRFERVKQRQSVLIAFIVAYLFAFIPFARNNYLAYEYAMGMLRLAPFYLAVVLHLDTFQRMRTFVTVYVGLMIYLCVRIMGFGPGEGVGSSFLHDENDYSLLLTMMAPFAFFMMYWEKRTLKKLLGLVALPLAGAALVISFSRGGFVGGVCVGVSMWLLSGRKLLSGLVIGAAVVGILLFADSHYWEEMMTIGDTGESTARERIETWKSGWIMFLHHPLGVGGGNFRVNFHLYQTDYFMRGMYGRVAHSVWVQMLTEVGVLGAIVFTWLGIRNVKDCLWIQSVCRRREDANGRFAYYLSLAFLVSMVGFFSSGTFLSVFYYPHYWYLSAMIVSTKGMVVRAYPELAA